MITLLAEGNYAMIKTYLNDRLFNIYFAYINFHRNHPPSIRTFLFLVNCRAEH